MTTTWYNHVLWHFVPSRLYSSSNLSAPFGHLLSERFKATGKCFRILWNQNCSGTQTYLSKGCDSRYYLCIKCKWLIAFLHVKPLSFGFFCAHAESWYLTGWKNCNQMNYTGKPRLGNSKTISSTAFWEFLKHMQDDWLCSFNPC